MNDLRYPLPNAHAVPASSVKGFLMADDAVGLSSPDAIDRLNRYGRNIIEDKKKISPVIIFFNQFKSPFVLLLLLAAGLSFYFKEWLDGIAILIVIFVNSIIGFLMEFQAERSMDALKRMTKVNAKVIRNGKLCEISSDEIVPGDTLYAEAGDIILADARIFNSSHLQADESALTGESMPVEKLDSVLPVDATLADRTNMLYKGTHITNGNVKALVTATGMQTELGRIAGLVQTADQNITPLEKKIEQFSKTILWITVSLIAVIFLSGVLYGDGIISMLETSIALAVAAIPEGLPIVTTLALAQGMIRMARHNVIVKKLSAVETLGGTNVICTDKTGTLTQNKIEVSSIITPEGKWEIKSDLVNRKSIPDSDSNTWLKRICVLCNTAELIFSDGHMKEVGDPLETALLKFAYADGIEIEPYREKYPKLGEEPFSSETRIMATLHADGQNNFVVAKGAVEEILRRCLMDEVRKNQWLEQAEQLATSGLRMIAVAYKTANGIPERFSEQLLFVGLIGMLDPPRAEVFAAVRECESAGITVQMITGDHPATAKNIALKLGIVNDEKEQVIIGKSMTAYENISAGEKQSWLKAKIFARVSPKQKLDLITVLQENNFVVGMTGDGVNDAPALKKADIGIAMGKRGTQVAQEVADMVLKDDSFSSIVLAIRQGRVIFENIRKFIIYLLSCNLSELLIISFSSVLNLHYSLFPLQILYINLVTDVLPALALGVTEGSDAIMKMPPRKASERIIDKVRWKSIIVYSVVMAACCLGAVFFTHETFHQSEMWNPELCNNILFITLILSQLWNVFNMTTDNSIAFHKSDVFRNKFVWIAIAACLILTIGTYFIPYVENVLSLYAPSGQDLAIMFGFSILSLVIIQTLKRMKVIL